MLKQIIWWFSEQSFKHLAKILGTLGIWSPSSEATPTPCFGKFFPVGATSGFLKCELLV